MQNGRIKGRGHSVCGGTRAERAAAASTASIHTHRAVEHAGNGRLQAGREFPRCVESGRVVPPPSCL